MAVRGSENLNNELAIGRLVWNRQRIVKNPETGKRVSRRNPESELNAYNVHQHTPAAVRERLANCPFLSDDETGEILEAVDKELSDWQYFLEKQEPPDLEAWLNEPDK